jgi:hypothetical protein
MRSDGPARADPTRSRYARSRPRSRRRRPEHAPRRPPGTGVREGRLDPAVDSAKLRMYRISGSHRRRNNRQATERVSTGGDASLDDEAQQGSSQIVDRELVAELAPMRWEELRCRPHLAQFRAGLSRGSGRIQHSGIRHTHGLVHIAAVASPQNGSGRRRRVARAVGSSGKGGRVRARSSAELWMSLP